MIKILPKPPEWPYWASQGQAKLKGIFSIRARRKGHAMTMARHTTTATPMGQVHELTFFSSVDFRLVIGMLYFWTLVWSLQKRSKALWNAF